MSFSLTETLNYILLPWQYINRLNVIFTLFYDFSTMIEPFIFVYYISRLLIGNKLINILNLDNLWLDSAKPTNPSHSISKTAVLQYPHEWSRGWHTTHTWRLGLFYLRETHTEHVSTRSRLAFSFQKAKRSRLIPLRSKWPRGSFGIFLSKYQTRQTNTIALEIVS